LFPRSKRDRRPTIIRKRDEPAKVCEDVIGRKIAKIDEEILNEIYRDSYCQPLKIEIENLEVKRIQEDNRKLGRRVMCIKANSEKKMRTVSAFKTPVRNCENSIGSFVSPMNLTPVMVKNSVKRINAHRHFAG